MKKVFSIFGILLITFILFICTFNYHKINEPKTFYGVYLDGEVIGVIESKEGLENYIDKQNDKYKKEFGVDKIYSPNGLQVQKMITYDGKVQTVKEVYNKIQKIKPFTISGYRITVTTELQSEENDTTNTVKKEIYVTKEPFFREAVQNVIKTYVGDEEYKNYIEKTQTKITTTGTYIDSIYLNDNITIKEEKIPINEKIYSNTEDLSQFLLYGDENSFATYIVKEGDTIESVSFNNKISTSEFLISNPTFTSKTNLLFAGQEVTIGITNPQIQVVVEQSSVEDIVENYETIIQYDESKLIGDDEVIQEGHNGLERVSQSTKIVNGIITYVTPGTTIELEPSVERIVVYGSKYIPSVGITSSWRWPTNSGYMISSYYGYRYHPLTGVRSLHGGIDIAGTGYGSNVYAANNGTIKTVTYNWSYGYYILIDHNNGYSTLYAHLSAFNNLKVGQIVARGQVIGYVGSSGSSTGPHLHFEVRHGSYTINPLSLRY